MPDDRILRRTPKGTASKSGSKLPAPATLVARTVSLATQPLARPVAVAPAALKS